MFQCSVKKWQISQGSRSWALKPWVSPDCYRQIEPLSQPFSDSTEHCRTIKKRKNKTTKTKQQTNKINTQTKETCFNRSVWFYQDTTWQLFQKHIREIMFLHEHSDTVLTFTSIQDFYWGQKQVYSSAYAVYHSDAQHSKIKLFYFKIQPSLPTISSNMFTRSKN